MPRLRYDPESGAVTVVSTRIRYRSISIDGTSYLEHHLVWLIHRGAWPTRFIDHINGDPSDNRIENLREVTQAENIQNQRRGQKSNKSTGLLGVTLRPNGRATSRIWVNGKNLFLGNFDTPDEAQRAYIDAKRKLHPGNTL
jgi:hypothetical protein